MRPVLQTQLYGDNAIGNGNCVAAAMASILELPLWMIPPWEQMFGRNDWHVRRRDWLAQVLGLEVVTLYASRRHPGRFSTCYWDDDDNEKPVYVELGELPQFYIACGLTVRGSQHATVYSGDALVHDPHYSGAGILSVERIEYFRQCEGAAEQRLKVPESALRAVGVQSEVA